MSTQRSTRNTQERNHQKRRLPNGNVFEFLASPAETGAEICLIRVTIPLESASRCTATPTWRSFNFLRVLLNASSQQTALRDGQPSAPAML